MKYTLTLIITLCQTLASFAQTDSEKYSKALEKYSNQDYPSAISIFKELADGNSTESIYSAYTLGVIYIQDSLVKADIPLGIKYLQKASNGGHMYASAILSGFSKDIPTIEKYLLLAISQGDTFFSPALLGNMYRTGGELSVPINKDKARKYYKIAAEQGEINSMFELGNIYNEEKNEKETLYWWTKAATEGNIDDLYVDIKSGLKSEAIESRNSALYNIGYNYYLKDDLQNAIPWLKLAADNGYAKAQLVVGCIYFASNETSMAIIYWEKGAAQNDATAQYCLGSIYYDLDEKEKAINFLKQSAAQGNKDAISKLNKIIQ